MVRRFLLLPLGILIAVLGLGCGQANPNPEATAMPTQLVTVPPTPVPVSPEPTAVPPTSPPEPTAVPTSTPEPPTVPLVDSGQLLGSARSWDVELGDLDGDGDMDAFVANDVRGDSGSAVWLNDGSGLFTLKEQDLGYGMGVALGDLDGDGDLDAALASWDEPARVLLNDGTGTFVDTGQLLGDKGGWDLGLGDLDGDGDLDACIAHEKADTVWWNDGTGTFADSGQRLGGSYTVSAGVADLDGDGDLDVLTVGWGESGRVWFNDGAGILTDSGQKLTPGYEHIHGMTLGDLDSDGFSDAFFAGAPNQVWFNDGRGTFTPSSQRLSSLAGDSVALGDLDGDGDWDVFLAVGDRSGSPDKVWLNDGQGQLTDSGLPLSDKFSSGVDLGDLDRDGDLDAFVVHGDLGLDRGGGLPNRVWLNGSPTAARRPLAAPPAGAVLGDTWTRPTDGMELVYVPRGSFFMGSTRDQIDEANALCELYPDDYGKCAQEGFQDEAPQHAVVLDGFWLDRTEVSNAQYALCVGEGACRESRLADNPGYNRDDYPVAGIPWQDGADYCSWAGGRLPTEAEWEYAARGTRGRTFPWGNEFECAGGNFWDGDTDCADGYPEPAPVGSFWAGASWCEALDMAGNVWEWVADLYGDYSAGDQSNPAGPVSGQQRILRGGSWGYGPPFVRTAYRYAVPPTADYLAVGVRCVISGRE